ncbi:hypothetical protein [Vibrio viridaestus]|uniref:Tail fiber assembly protein n=1 Tax=Vibrio viridaestus TaxID=2487322 RepID=A0A3N9TIK5_9VIBR|nr:hypothetical protein [Vibrio viridaestus]RQW64041.1 hypothetical protein EES38_05400 [Vibrio viridaestus]
MKIAYHYSFKTCLFTGTSKVFPDQGYQDCVLPQFATWTALPEYNSDIQQCRYDKENDSWLIEVIPVPVTAYNKETLESKEFDDASVVGDEYTLNKPSTQFDEWVNGTGWVTNVTTQYEYNYSVIDAKRRAAYVKTVSPLLEEAQIKRLIGTSESISEAESLEAQAIEARELVQSDNPWPIKV